MPRTGGRTEVRNVHQHKIGSNLTDNVRNKALGTTGQTGSVTVRRNGYCSDRFGYSVVMYARILRQIRSLNGYLCRSPTGSDERK